MPRDLKSSSVASPCASAETPAPAIRQDSWRGLSSAADLIRVSDVRAAFDAIGACDPRDKPLSQPLVFPPNETRDSTSSSPLWSNNEGLSSHEPTEVDDKSPAGFGKGARGSIRGLQDATIGSPLAVVGQESPPSSPLPFCLKSLQDDTSVASDFFHPESIAADPEVSDVGVGAPRARRCGVDVLKPIDGPDDSDGGTGDGGSDCSEGADNRHDTSTILHEVFGSSEGSTGISITSDSSLTNVEARRSAAMPKATRGMSAKKQSPWSRKCPPRRRQIVLDDESSSDTDIAQGCPGAVRAEVSGLRPSVENMSPVASVMTPASQSSAATLARLKRILRRNRDSDDDTDASTRSDDENTDGKSALCCGEPIRESGVAVRRGYVTSDGSDSDDFLPRTTGRKRIRLPETRGRTRQGTSADRGIGTARASSNVGKQPMLSLDRTLDRKPDPLCRRGGSASAAADFFLRRKHSFRFHADDPVLGSSRGQSATATDDDFQMIDSDEDDLDGFLELDEPRLTRHQKERGGNWSSLSRNAVALMASRGRPHPCDSSDGNGDDLSSSGSSGRTGTTAPDQSTAKSACKRSQSRQTSSKIRAQSVYRNIGDFLATGDTEASFTRVVQYLVSTFLDPDFAEMSMEEPYFANALRKVLHSLTTPSPAGVQRRLQRRCAPPRA